MSRVLSTLCHTLSRFHVLLVAGMYGAACFSLTLLLMSQFAPTTVDALPTGSTLSHYAVTGLIGQGGFGVVYLARDTRSNRTVVLPGQDPARGPQAPDHATY